MIKPYDIEIAELEAIGSRLTGKLIVLFEQIRGNKSLKDMEVEGLYNETTTALMDAIALVAEAELALQSINKSNTGII